MSYGYDPIEDLLKVTSTQKKWRDGFATAALDSRKWTSQVAAGGVISVASGALTLSSGANANDETWILSTETFSVPFRVSVGLTLSQRIANQSFYLEAVSIDRDSSQPDGLETAIKSFGELTGFAQLRASGRQGAANADALIDYGHKDKWQARLVELANQCAARAEADWETYSKAYDKGVFIKGSSAAS